MIYGRDEETARLAEVLDAAADGRGSVLVVRGEAGIGKSALLAGVATADRTVLRVTGVEAEADLPFAALHALLRPVLHRLDSLPAPQATALRAAFGVAEGNTDGRDRFLVGLAVLTLLAEAAEERLVVCLVDDAQWLDEASADALLFAARRLEVERVAVVFCVRDGANIGHRGAQGLPELVLRSLDDAWAAALLAEHRGDLAPAVRDRVVAESGGNPLTLIELSRALDPDKLPPLGLHTETSSPLGRVEHAFRERIDALPEPTRTLLVVAAAEGAGDLGLVMRAAGARGADLDPAEHAGLVRVDGDRLAFRHPLVKAAAYRGATLSRRQDAHRALADALGDADEDTADRRAHHLAAATTGTDEPLGDLLAHTAARAGRRGAPAVAATVYERAAQLTEDRELRAGRLAQAAEKAAEAGQLARAGELAERGARLARAPEVVAALVGVRAAREFELGNAATAGRLVVAAVAPITAAAPEQATTMLGAAAAYAWFAGDGETLRQAARLTAEMPGSHVSDMVRGTELLLSGDHTGGLRLLRSALPATGDSTMAATYAVFGALRTGADREAATAAEDFARTCREQGWIGELSHALQLRTQANIFLGRHSEARADGAEALRIAEDTGHSRRAAHVRGVLSLLAAIEGDTTRCEPLANAGIDGELAPGASWGRYALGLLALGRGDHSAAAHHLTELLAGPVGHTVIARFAVPSLVEAQARLGIQTQFARFADWAQASGQSWALGVAHRCHALLSASQEAEQHYVKALEHHTTGTRPFEEARTQLLYGEWLRRNRRRSAAAVQLRAAAATFRRLNAATWLTRTETELTAIGARTADAPSLPDGLDVLTAQEAQVVRLAATGASNREIAAQLFLSPRTVGYHLYNAFPKLGVTSRTELTRYA